MLRSQLRRVQDEMSVCVRGEWVMKKRGGTVQPSFAVCAILFVRHRHIRLTNIYTHAHAYTTIGESTHVDKLGHCLRGKMSTDAPHTGHTCNVDRLILAQAAIAFSSAAAISTMNLVQRCPPTPTASNQAPQHPTQPACVGVSSV